MSTPLRKKFCVKVNWIIGVALKRITVSDPGGEMIDIVKNETIESETEIKAVLAYGDGYGYSEITFIFENKNEN